MLRQPQEATLKALMRATKWQADSVRGFGGWVTRPEAAHCRWSIGSQPNVSTTVRGGPLARGRPACRS
jgi:hypothetical protein